MFRGISLLVVATAFGLSWASMPQDAPGAPVGIEEALAVVGGHSCQEASSTDCDWLNFCNEDTCFMDTIGGDDFYGEVSLPHSCGSSCYTVYYAINELACAP